MRRSRQSCGWSSSRHCGFACEPYSFSFATGYRCSHDYSLSHTFPIIADYYLLYFTRDLMIHAQYGQDRGFREELGRAVNTLPGAPFLAPADVASWLTFFNVCSSWICDILHRKISHKLFDTSFPLRLVCCGRVIYDSYSQQGGIHAR